MLRIGARRPTLRFRNRKELRHNATMMQPRRVITHVLLLFALVSLAVAIVRDWHGGVAPLSSEARPARPDTLVLFLFHNTERCATCNLFETFTRDLLQRDFAAAMRAGRLQFRVLDEEQPANRPLADAYGVVGPALVLVHFVQGRAGAWESLEDAVPLVDERDKFQEYVGTRIRTHLDRNAAEKAEKPPHAASGAGP
jgi:hypothetical protein